MSNELGSISMKEIVDVCTNIQVDAKEISTVQERTEYFIITCLLSVSIVSNTLNVAKSISFNNKTFIVYADKNLPYFRSFPVENVPSGIYVSITTRHEELNDNNRNNKQYSLGQTKSPW